METDPIQYPKIKLGAELFEVKYRAGDLIRLKKDHGIELGDMATLKGIDAFERMIILLQAGIAHQTKKTIEELADQIDLAEFAVYTDAVNQAISKVSPQAAAIIKRNQEQAKLAAAPATQQ